MTDKSSYDQGYEDWWHYDFPRQQSNEQYMLGWDDAWRDYFAAEVL